MNIFDKFSAKNTPFVLFVLIFFSLVFFQLLHDGMFMDALLYSSVSHNLAIGRGTFWFPQFGLTKIAGLDAFHEHPPLVFGIQALFFKVFGDSIYVERFYTFLLLILTTYLIYKIWNTIYSNQLEYKQLGWLPILFWITTPVVLWSFSNNMQENTMGIFTILSVLLSYISFKTNYKPIYWLFSGLFVFFATLSKGIPGFFPLSIPILYWLATKQISLKTALFHTFTMLGIVTVIYLILFNLPNSSDSLRIYIFKRLLERVNNAPTVSSHFYSLYRIFSELIPAFFMMFLLWIAAKKMKLTYTILTIKKKEAIFFILIGFAASVPLMITLVQKGFYLTPSFPYFSIALALYAAPYISQVIEKIDTKSFLYKIIKFGFSILLLGILIFAFVERGKPSRNKELLNDVYLFGKVIDNKVVSASGEARSDWSLLCYMMRYFSIDLEVNHTHKYLILEKDKKSDSLFKYEKLDLKTLQYDLYIEKK